jgi:hypothetical protein
MFGIFDTTAAIYTKYFDCSLLTNNESSFADVV